MRDTKPRICPTVSAPCLLNSTENTITKKAKMMIVTTALTSTGTVIIEAVPSPEAAEDTLIVFISFIGLSIEDTLGCHGLDTDMKEEDLR